MIEFNYEGRYYKMTTDWSEMTLRQFINLNKIQDKNKVLKMPDEIITLQLIECLSDVGLGGFDEMSYGQLNELAENLAELLYQINTYDPTATKPSSFFVVNGTNYSYRLNSNEYTVGEIADIKTFIQNKTNEWDYIADIAAVMIRPATKQTTEGGKEYWKLIKRNSLDFESNKEVILGMKLSDVLQVVNFFLIGLMGLTNDTKNSSEIKEESMG
jgi:hypothetical protein